MELLGGWSEDRLHRWLASQDWPTGLVGSRGHDAAVLASHAGHMAVCTDQCIEGVHVETSSPGEALGRKAVLRTLSDLAATAATPHAVTLALRAPAARDESWLRAVILAAREAAVAHGAELVAGDLAAAPGPPSAAVCAYGSVDPMTAPVGRDRARPGQRIVLTGAVGGSLQRGRHLAPTPRFGPAQRLVRAGATAMMDVSDGLALDLFRLARASRVRLRVEVGRVPIHADAHAASEASGRSALEHALHDGEDHELVATLDGEPPSDCVEIGRVEAGEGLAFDGPGGSQEWNPSRGGWTHGGVGEEASPG